jgi:hypothetical protein
MRSSYLSACLVVSLGLGCVSASAYEFKIDDFKVVRNGATMFDDPFSDGSPPPSAPNFVSNGQPAAYTLNASATLGPETGGKLTLLSSDGDVSPGVNKVLYQQARLNTNTDPASTSGLKQDTTFSVSGLWDLRSARFDAEDEAFAVRLTDGTAPNTGDDTLSLMVRRTGPQALVAEFVHNDTVAGTSTTLASLDLEQTHDQILLTLSRVTTASNTITASYSYVDAGVVGPSITLPASHDIFHGETFTRAAFFARAPYAYGVASGEVSRLTLGAHIRAAISSQGKAGNLYIAALVGTQLYFKQGSDWVFWPGTGPIPVYATRTALSPDETVSVVDGLDLTALSGTQVFAGYGETEADLLANSTYTLIYTVPCTVGCPWQ